MVSAVALLISISSSLGRSGGTGRGRLQSPKKPHLIHVPSDPRMAPHLLPPSHNLAAESNADERSMILTGLHGGEERIATHSTVKMVRLLCWYTY